MPSASSEGRLPGLVTHPHWPMSESLSLCWVKDKGCFFPPLQDCLFLLFSFAKLPFRARRGLYFQLEILAANLAEMTSIPIFMYQPVCLHTLAYPCPLRKIFSLQREKIKDKKRRSNLCLTACSCSYLGEIPNPRTIKNNKEG